MRLYYCSQDQMFFDQETNRQVEPVNIRDYLTNE